MIFGSLDQALAASRNLYALHTRIRGEMAEDIAAYRRGSHYEANEIVALRWVYATLVESAVLAHECVMPALTPRELADYLCREQNHGGPVRTAGTRRCPSDWPRSLPIAGRWNNRMHWA